MKNYIITGMISAAIIILVIIVFITFISPINYAPIYLLNPENALSYNDSIAMDSIKCLHIEMLKDLESKGILLSPSEYTSHIADYYNALFPQKWPYKLIFFVKFSVLSAKICTFAFR